MTALDFLGVKVGDVNASAKANAQHRTQTRNKEVLTMLTDDQALEPGQLVEIPVYASKGIQLEGFQFTLNYNNELLQWTDWRSGAVEITASNIGEVFTSRGMLTSSWNGDVVVSNESQPLFTLVFRAMDHGQLRDQLFISSDVTRAEAYALGGAALDVKLAFRGDLAGDSFTLYQNTPNPFAEETVIRFALPRAEPATLTIYDVNGKVIMSRLIDGVKGMNELTIHGSLLQSAGVLYYQLDTRSHSATKRMILLQ